MTSQTEIVPGYDVTLLIRSARERRVILDSDLARIYGVETRTLNQAVKRNADRFPADFVFQLTVEERADVLALRSQSVILKPGRGQHGKTRDEILGDITVCDILDSYPLMHHQPQPEPL